MSAFFFQNRAIVAFFAACLLSQFHTDELNGSDKKPPTKVFVLVGQSNMQGHAHVRTIPDLSRNPDTAVLLEKIQNENGELAEIDDVWISYLSTDGEKSGPLMAGYGANGEKIGPELAFGITMQSKLQEPIVLIKAAWGGKSLHTDFRPPGSGPYQFQEPHLENLKKRGRNIDEIRAEKRKATGHYYHLTVEHVKSVLADLGRVFPEYDEKIGYELAGFVWFQGWNDMVDQGTYPRRDQSGGYEEYSRVMAQFIRDIRRELAAPELPFVIGVLGVNGPVAHYPPNQKRYTAVHQNFRDAMAAPATLSEFSGNTKAVLTENYWDRQLHSLRLRQAEIAQQMKKLRQEAKLSKQEINAREKELNTEKFSEEEREILATGVSNLEYHYLGSSRILFRIGEAFANANFELLK